MDLAVARLIRARAAQEPLVIFGDYDVDGVSASALLSDFFQALGWTAFTYLPHRLEEGYGLTPGGVRNCLQKHPVKLLLAVDCGSGACEVVSELARQGVDAIILDHHQFAEPAPAAALVNPRIHSGETPFQDLCSAGLAFKLAHALLKKGRALGWPGADAFDLKDSLDLAALGTIADMVPLSRENRILAHAGLRKIAATKRIGLRALKNAAGVNGVATAASVGFGLGPRLNAAGRLETALDALELLLCRDPARASALAASLDAQNRARQEIERKTASEAISALRERFNPAADYALVQGHASWHAGVVGIVASRVLREFHRPTIILGGDGESGWRGSGRGIEGFDLAAALRQCGDLLSRHGGHAMAAGLSIPERNVEAFRQRLNALAKAALPPELLQPAIELDAEVPLEAITFPLLKSFEALEPFGQGNPPVQLAARALRLCSDVRQLGEDGRHWKFMVTDGRTARQAIWWSTPADLELPPRFDLAFAPELNEYNGTFAIQLRVLDFKPA